MPKINEDQSQRIYKRSQWEVFFSEFDAYIFALIDTKAQTADCTEEVRLTKLRKDLIDHLLDKEYDLP